ncbi:MAG: bifunctional precorrin-2 dehydrogenase/sirohydrochlorin ferrochelatase [Desulfovibrionaceae bacterium]|nr:bifunctional precorrin-2 dehydrogenase/sirohydrochlorin ferrochelatase [Desulfovibrionaceae bacterium]
MPQYYPVLLSLTGLSCLVLGFGEVGRRKVEMLLPAEPASLLVLDPCDPSPEGAALLERAAAAGIVVRLSKEPFGEAALEGMTLVFTCSGDHELNARVAALCRERRILCNCTDNPPAGSFHVPVVVRNHPLTATLSTDRASPALSRRWKGELAAFLAPKAPLAALMGRLRPLVLALGAPSDANRELFRRLASPELEKALAKGDAERAATFLETYLPEALRPEIPRLVGESCSEVSLK